MKEYGIEFTPNLIPPILRDEKTETRPIIPEKQDKLGKLAVGDHLWVRERFTVPWFSEAEVHVRYLADDSVVGVLAGNGISPEWHAQAVRANRHKAQSARFMPKWASRIRLEVLGVHKENLRDITTDGGRREGITTGFFSDTWDALHRKPGTRWQDNPTVRVIKFRRIP